MKTLAKWKTLTIKQEENIYATKDSDHPAGRFDRGRSFAHVGPNGEQG
jgi:hypothetical protein